MVKVARDFTNLEADIQFFNKWITTGEPSLVNPANGATVQSLDFRFNLEDTEVAFELKEIHSQTVDFASANTWVDTGYDIPPTGDIFLVLQIDRLSGTDTSNAEYITVNNDVVTRDLRTLPLRTVGASTTTGSAGTHIVITNRNPGFLRGVFERAVIHEFQLARTGRSDLLIASNSVFRNTPFSVLQPVPATG